MARPIWTGTLSFGLLNVPIRLMAGEKRSDLHFRMLDSRDNAPIRYERVNSETGEEVPWQDIVKAFEYRKGSYVVLEEGDLRAAAPETHETVEIAAFVDAASITPDYFEKPYVLVPGKKAEKGYVLLRETLAETGKIGIARVVIRTKEYLSAVIVKDDALILMLLRYPEELVDLKDFEIPSGNAAAHRVTKREVDMARQLIDAMAMKWKPSDYRDEFSDRLHKVIAKRMKSKGLVTPPAEEAEPAEATTNVVDFMELLRKSIASNKRSPAGKKARAAPAKSARTKSARKTTRKRGRKSA
ncbi:MAG TPA: Ku protein [Rhodanobacteraceae bacterium]|nr:Ku protein [Rhodanobacteraceae bacterium]